MKQVRIFNKENSIFNQYLKELRDVNIQGDRMRFRRNLERMGELFSYEISKTLDYRSEEVTTPLGITTENVIDDQVVLATILRAGLPLHQGMMNYFDNAQNCFISAFRRSTGADTFEIEVEYLASPSIEDKVLILCDPMLASGRSMVLCYEAVLAKGKPKAVHVVASIGSQEGVDYVSKHLPDDAHLWIGAVDEILDENSYIVPGLGDAGDLAYGTKS